MTITISDRADEQPTERKVAVISYAFTTDGSGDASEETTLKVIGQVKRMVTNPDDTDTPTAGWDVTIKDEDGVDILCGNGADRDADGSKASEQAFPCPANVAIASKLTFTVANGGNAKKGVVKLYIV